MEPEVKPGDYVISKEWGEDIREGGCYLVTDVSTNGKHTYIHFKDDRGDRRRRPLSEYTVVPASKPEPAPEPTSALEVQVGGSHYKDMKIQPIAYIMANKIPFPEGNVIKYVSRWRKKAGVQDLKKARHMLDTIIEAVEAGEYA